MDKNAFRSIPSIDNLLSDSRVIDLLGLLEREFLVQVIREITEKTGAKIEIDDEGLVSIAAVDSKSGQAAIDWVNSIVEEPEIGKVYEGKVVKLMDFGAFVNFMGSRDGLVHISQLKNERVEKVEDVVKEGDIVKVKVLDVDSRGKVKLSMKEVDSDKES